MEGMRQHWQASMHVEDDLIANAINVKLCPGGWWTWDLLRWCGHLSSQGESVENCLDMVDGW